MIFGIYHFCLALFGAIVFGWPSKKIQVIGVTGTKGKSTTLWLLAHILRQAGHKVGVLSSAWIMMADKQKPNTTGNTMPGRMAIQKYLWDAKRAGCDIALVEVTSQGVLQHRHRFIDWNGVVFLDIHPEHIEAHGSFEKYLEAKVAFFSYAARHAQKNKTVFFINDKDEHAQEFIDVAKGNATYLFNADDVRDMTKPQTLEGEFNITNIAAAWAVAKHYNVSRETFQKELESFGGLAGRMEYVQRTPFAVVVDYAHTPDSLEGVYKHVKNHHKELICVLGSAGGGRDKWKRAAMGEIAARYCNEIILTNEDPFEEDPRQIVADIEEGIKKYDSNKKYEIIMDRKEAIEKAIKKAGPNDIIVISGKGSEQYIRVKKGKKIPWSDVKTAKDVLKEKTGH